MNKVEVWAVVMVYHDGYPYVKWTTDPQEEMEAHDGWILLCEQRIRVETYEGSNVHELALQGEKTRRAEHVGG